MSLNDIQRNQYWALESPELLDSLALWCQVKFSIGNAMCPGRNDQNYMYISLS